MTTYLENLLGALGLSLTDFVADSLVDGSGQLAEAVVLLALRPGTSIKRLAERLRLSHPGAVRLADRLEAAGWATRAQGQDRRSVRLTLTAAGEAEVERVRTLRAKRLGYALDVLSPEERRALEPIAEKLLRRLTVDPVAAYANCRLCDTPACEAHGCPVEAEARVRFLPQTPDPTGAR